MLMNVLPSYLYCLSEEGHCCALHVCDCDSLGVESSRSNPNLNCDEVYSSHSNFQLGVWEDEDKKYLGPQEQERIKNSKIVKREFQCGQMIHSFQCVLRIFKQETSEVQVGSSGTGTGG